MNATDRDETPAQLLALVGGRYKFLAILNVEPYTKQGIEDMLNVSRSTVDRAIRELETVGLVRRTERGYRTTLYGSTLTAIYDSFLDHFGYVSHAKPLLGELPPDVDFNLDLVIDAEIVVAEEPAIHAPAARIADLLKPATEFRGLAYAHTSPEASELFEQRVLDVGIPADVVFREQMYENLEATHPNVVDELVDADNCTVRVASGIPFGLFLLTVDGTEHVCLVVYDAEQTLKGVLINDTAKAITWAERLFRQYRARATPPSER